MQRNGYEYLRLRMFYAIGVTLVAWRIAPGDHGSLFLFVVAVVLGAAGGHGVLLGFLALWRSRPPRPLSLMPPAWLAAWLVIFVVALLVGTPHVRVKQNWKSCSYIGWNGRVELRDSTCPYILILPLPNIIRAED